MIVQTQRWGPVRQATLVGIVIGVIIGAYALGYVTSATPEQVANAYKWAWLIVVSTSALQVLAFLAARQPISGPFGGFINGLGTGLGVFLLYVGRVL